jgi:hypothetical protein
MVKANLMIVGSVSCLVLGLGLVGCSNPKDASKENFAKVLSQKIAKQPYRLVNGKEPCVMEVHQIGIETLEDEPQEALVKLGLLSSRTVGQASVSSNGSREQKIYELTDKGKQTAEPRGTNIQNPTRYGFRYCKVVFKEILSYAEPSGGYGPKAARVKYAYTLEGIPDWAKDETLLNLDSTMKGLLGLAGKAIPDEQSLVLTNEGWATDLPG